MALDRIVERCGVTNEILLLAQSSWCPYLLTAADMGHRSDWELENGLEDFISYFPVLSVVFRIERH